tara:strand:- start:16723 stop:17916 length:1194 start_codon:yes stop_codon:yes gene_type:complete
MNNIKKILLIISGGIAAYKSLELIRIFTKNKIKVITILTSGGSKFITPLSISGLSGERVYDDLFSLKDETEMGHIQLSREVDALLVAPASANIIARTANGLADDLASTVILASNKPIYFVPSMNVEMWKNPITQNNIKQLKLNNIKIIGPESGDLACGEEGDGRMSEPEKIYKSIISYYKKKKLNINALITAGPTYEPIDPVRFIANKSSGKQGIAIAKSLDKLGIKVSLIIGPNNETIPSSIKVINIITAKEMFNSVKKIKNADIAICNAAVSDWTIKNPSNTKIKKNTKNPKINLTNNPDILKSIAKRKKNRPKLVIGFAAETNNLIINATKKLKEKECDWIIANDVLKDPDIFGGEKNKITFISNNGIEKWKKTSKNNIAEKLSNKILEFFKNE